MDLNDRLKKIKFILTDVDGVLTRGEIFFDALGNELKIWNVRDGLSFSIIKRLPDLEAGFLTGRTSESVTTRAAGFGIKYVFQGVLNKIQVYEDLKKNLGLLDDEIMYLGDDLIDLSVLKKAGISICPLDAVNEVKNVCDIVADVRGGYGVFRFALKKVLESQNRWDGIEKLFEVS